MEELQKNAKSGQGLRIGQTAECGAYLLLSTQWGGASGQFMSKLSYFIFTLCHVDGVSRWVFFTLFIFKQSVLGGALTQAYLDFACSNRSVIEVHNSSRGLLVALESNHGFTSWETFVTELQAD